MECPLLKESIFKIEARNSPHLLAYVANALFEENWILEEGKKCTSKKSQTITENETPCKNPPPKKIQVYTLPPRPAVFKMSQDFVMISYKDMTESITTSSK